MFASDGWFWDDPIRPETKHILLCAAKAVRLIDDTAGTDIESHLLDDLSLFTSPSRRIDGAGIYAEALTEAGQPVRRPRSPVVESPGTIGSRHNRQVRLPDRLARTGQRPRALGRRLR
jgi:hypothetical protein